MVYTIRIIMMIKEYQLCGHGYLQNLYACGNVYDINKSLKF